MSKAYAAANAWKKKQQEAQSMPKEQRYEQTYVQAVNSLNHEQNRAIQSVQNLSQQIAENDRTGAYKGTLTDQHLRINDLSSLRSQLQNLRKTFGLDIGDISDLDNAIKQQTKFVGSFKNDGEYRTGYWFGEKYKGSNKQQVQSAIASLEKGNDAQKGEALWLKQNQYQYWDYDTLKSQMEANLAEAKRLRSLVNEVYGAAKSNRQKQYGSKITALKSEAEMMRRAMENKALENELKKFSRAELDQFYKYGEEQTKADDYVVQGAQNAAASNNPFAAVASARLGKGHQQKADELRKMLKNKGYSDAQIGTLLDYSIKSYNAKSVQDQAALLENLADTGFWGKVAASAGAVYADLGSGIGALDIAAQNLTRGENAFTGMKSSVDYNARAQQLGLAGENAKAAVMKDMGKLERFLYGTGMSIAESAIGVGTSPLPIGEALLGGLAAQSSMQEAHRRGASDIQALLAGALAGAAETTFEHLSFENLRGIINAEKAVGSGLKGAIERTLLQGGVEGSEEFFTTLANTASEAIILGDKSELKNSISTYMQQGMTEKEATKKAAKEWAVQLGLDAAGGFLSGGAMVQGTNVRTAIGDAAVGQDIIDANGETALIKEALSLGENSPAYKVAQGLKDQLAEGQKNKTDVKLSKSKLGELQRKVVQQAENDANSERAQIERQLPRTHESLFLNENGDVTVGVQASRVAEALIASGESASVAVSKAPIIEKIVAGKEVTDAELKKMGVFSAAVAKVVNTYTQSDINPANASESELIKAYHAAAAQQKTRIDAVVKMGEDIKAARAKLEAEQAEGEARLAEQEAALDEETQAAAAELEQSAPEQEQQSGSVIKVTNGDGAQVDMTLQDYIDSARQVNPDDPRSDAELAEEFNTLLGHAAMNGGMVRAEDVPNILRGATEAQVSEEAPAAEEETTAEEAPAAEEEEPAAEEGTGEEETKKESKPKAEPKAEEPEAPVESVPKEKRPLGEQIAKDIYFLQEEGNEVKELKDEQIWAMQIAMPLLRQAGIKNLVVDETATAGANAFIDDGDGTIRINPKQMKSQIMILRILAHEIVHPATNDNGKTNNKAEKIIDSFIAMYNQGVLTGKLESLVKDYINGEAIKDARKRYEEFLGHSVSDHYINQELASDMVGLVGDNRPVMEKLVGYQPDLMTKILRKINSWRNGTTIMMIKNDDQRKAAEQALDQIATDINNALRKSKLAAFQPKTKAQQRADQRAEKLAAKAQKQNAERVSRVKERARTADTGESVAESASPENKSVAKAMARLNKGANRTRSARASLGLFPKDSNERRAIEALGSGAEVTTNGDDELVLAKSKDNHTIMYSNATLYGIGDYYEAHPEAKSGIELLKQTLKANGHTDAEIAEVIKGIEASAKELTDLSERISQEYGWEEMKEHISMEIVTDLRDAQQVIYTLTPNGEYPVNLDLALVCKKRVAYTRVLAQLVRDGVLDEISFGSKAIAKVNEILRDAGFETACLGCFVESRRTAIQNWAEDFIFEWNKVVDEIDPNAGYFNFTYTRNPETGERENETPALSVKDVAALDRLYEFNGLNKQGNVSFSSSGPLDKVIELFREKRESNVLLKKLRLADLMTPEGITAIKRTDKTLFNLAKGRYGAAQPKVLQSFHPYAGDMTNATFEEVARKTGKDFKGTKQYREAAVKLLEREPNESDKAYETRMRKLGLANLNGKADRERRIDALAMRLYLYDIGGARIQSFSDFMIENTLDYLQIIADMSAARLPMHGYTKEIIAMKLFGMTGLKWNGSLIAHVDPAEDKNHAGLLPVSEASDGRGIVLAGPSRVENGVAYGEQQWAICFDDYDRNVRTGKPAKDYLAAHGGVVKNLTEVQKAEYKRLKRQESYIQSIGMKDIFALMMDPRYSKNIGNITIGVSDVQIIAMLRSDLFTMVIPYHKSGLPKIFAELMGIENYNNYEDYQKTTVKQVFDANGKPIEGFIRKGGKVVHADTEAFNFNEALQRHKGNARAAAKDYIKWCKKRHEILDSKGNVLGYETFNPKFSSSPNGFNFAEDPLTRDYYYKLLEDFTALDPVTGKWTPQGAVQQYEMKRDGTYDLSKPLLPSESNRLTDEQKEQYRERLRGIGVYTEAEIDKIIQKADMTFSELVRTEAENRGRYHHEVDPKFDGTYEEILEALSDPELRSTRAERDAERQRDIDAKAAEKAKKAAAKAVKADKSGERYSLPSDPAEMDRQYMDAVERGDMKTAQRMVDEAARRAGYTELQYHGTDVDFTEFKVGDIGFHVGTEAQARSRLNDRIKSGVKPAKGETRPRIMKLYVKTRNPLVAAMDFGSWHGKSVALGLLETEEFIDGIYPNADEINARLEEIAKMPDVPHTDGVMRDFLKSLGFDSIIYGNEFEDMDPDDFSEFNSGDSILVFDADQLKSANPVVYDNDGNLIPLSERFNPENEDIRYSIDPAFVEDIDEWDADGRRAHTIFNLGSTSEALQALGVREGDVRMDSEKIEEILRDHPEMTLDEIKMLPEILEDPVLIMKSHNAWRNQQGQRSHPNTRLVIFGTKKAKNGLPIRVALDIKPANTGDKINFDLAGMQAAVSAYTKDNPSTNADFLRRSYVLYADKRAATVLRSVGFQLPTNLLRSGYMGSVTHKGPKVKLDGVPFSDVFRDANGDRYSLNPDLFLTDDYKTYYQELFSDKGLSPEAVKKARANAQDEKTSRIATTYKNFFDANERRRKGLRKGDLGYIPDTNAESMQRAQDRLDADFQGEYEKLKKNGLNTDDDVDAAMGILNVLVTDARSTKDYKDVADWLQRIRANATRSGQIVQAFAKYAQTPEGILIEAEEILAQTDLSKADQGIILAQLAQFATTLNAIKKGEEGNRDDLIDLILDQAAIRNTKVSNQTLKDLYRQKIDFLYDAALNQMSQIAQDYLKPSLAKGAATYQTISHLFNARTAARNVVSNTVFSPVAAVANNLAVVPDIIISLFTKQKTVGFDRWWFSGKTWKGVEEGARRAHVEIALDIDPRPNSRDKYGTSRRTWKMTGNAASRVGSTIEKAMGFELNWTDEFHKGAVEAEILQSLQGLVDKGVIREEDAEEWARQEALYRSFQDDTFLSARLQDIKNLLNTVGFGHTGRYLGAKAQTPFNEIKEFGLGDLIQKYTQVPGALITRAVEFSPIGYVKMFSCLAQMKNVNKALRTAEMRLQEAQDELDQEPDSAALINRVFQAQKAADSARFKAQSKQRMAALAMGRATTGVGLIKLFAMLAASGLMHRPDDDDDPDATAMLQSMGVTGTQVNMSALIRKWFKGGDGSWKKGDQLWAIDFLEPLNGLMTIGVKIIKEAKDDKTFKDKLDSAQRGTIDGLWNVIGEIPTMQSLGTIQQTLKYYDPEIYPNRATAVGIELARGSATGFVPSLIRQTAQATDTVQRNTYTSKKPLQMTKDQLQNTLPYFRNKLPAKLDNYGQPRKQENPLLNALNAYVIPGSIRTYQVSPEAKELASVSKKTGDVNIYPDRNPPSKITVSVDGEDYSYNLSAKQKQTYQATRGKYSYQFQHDMMSDPFYKSATAQEKNAMLTEAKQLADYMAKKEFLSKQKDAPDYTDSSHEKTLGALANGYTVASWVDVRTTTNKAKGVDADGDGKADSGTKKKEQLGIIQSYDLNDTQKTYWFRGSDYNGSDSGRDYIGEAIDQHITPTKYIDAALKLLDAHGTDNNNDGKTDSGSVRDSKAAIINSLPLTAEQKKWLFLQGNSTSTKFANSYNWTDTSGN